MSENTVRHPEWPEGFQNHMTITEAAAELGIEYPNYIRVLIKSGKVTGQKLTRGKKVQWAIDPDSVAHYDKTRGSFGEGRGGGRSNIRRYVLRVNPEVAGDYYEVEEALAEALGEGFLSLEKPKYYKPKAKDNADGSPDKPTQEWKVATLESLTPDTDDEDEDDDSGMDL